MNQVFAYVDRLLDEAEKRADERNLLVRRAQVQSDRRFTGEPLTGFGDLTDDADYSNFGERAARMAEYDRELADDCRGIGDDSCADWSDEGPR